jgi:hypothetical protein
MILNPHDCLTQGAAPYAWDWGQHCWPP